MIWDDYVAGRSVAVVGPAPMVEDQSAHIDAHDIVYRVATTPVGGAYGTRTDVVYLNGLVSRTIFDDDQTELLQRIDPATWWVFKTPNGYRREGLYRKARRPRISGLNVNAVTGILFDLVQSDVGTINVFGADLYAGGPDAAYHPDYTRRPLSGQALGFIMHEPFKQMRVHRAIVATGKVGGDSRYLAAVSMTDEEYQAVIDRWAACLEEATV
jgi:hypothetical protein